MQLQSHQCLGAHDQIFPLNTATLQLEYFAVAHCRGCDGEDRTLDRGTAIVGQQIPMREEPNPPSQIHAIQGEGNII